MNKAVEKMITYLKLLTESAKDKVDLTSEKDLIEFGTMGSAMALLSMWLESDSPFSNLKIISDDMVIVNAVIDSAKNKPDSFFQFKDKEITNILFYIIKKNIENGILEENEVKEITIARENATKDTSLLELLQIGRTKTFYDTYKGINRVIMSKVEQKPNEIYMLKMYNSGRTKGLRVIHKRIKQYYLDKEKTFTKDDIEIIVDCLKCWGLSKVICESVRATLELKLSKRKETSKEIEIKKVEHVSKPTLTKKQYHAIINELESKFDLERMEPQPYATLTPEEISHCVSLMEELNFPFRKIEIFVEKSFKKAREEMRSIHTKIRTLKEKIEFYGIQNEIVSEALLNIEMYLPEYENSIPADKDEWYQIIDTEIEKANACLPKGYEYEKSLIFKPKED